MPIEQPQKAPTEKDNAGSMEKKQKVVPLEGEARSNTNARSQRKASTGSETVNAPKRERRVAPECTLVRTEEFNQATKHKSAEYVIAVIEEAEARMHMAEARLCGVDEIITIGSVGPVATFDRWWTAFPFDDQWFVLRCREAFIRRYELLPASGPSPDDGGPEPTLKRLQKGPPPKRIAPPPRARRKQGDAKGARGAVTEEPRRIGKGPQKGKAKKNAKRIATYLVRRLAGELGVLRDTTDHTCEQLWRPIRPHLLRSVAVMRLLIDTVSHAMCDARASFVQLVQRNVTFVTSNAHKSLTDSRPNSFATGGLEARLEPRLACQNTGLALVLHSWVRIDALQIERSQPCLVDWDAGLFG